MLLSPLSKPIFKCFNNLDYISMNLPSNLIVFVPPFNMSVPLESLTDTIPKAPARFPCSIL